jgi:Spy/CpxP family protein refolding chaperone
MRWLAADVPERHPGLNVKETINMHGKQVTKRSAALAALCLIMGLAAAAAAQPGRGPDGGRGDGFGPDGGRGDGFGPGAHMGRLWERLDLTPEQRDKMAKLRETGQAEGLALRKDLMRLRHELRGEMLKDAPEGRAVEQFAARIGELQGKLQAHRLRQRLALRALLTPEQRDRLLLLEAQRGPRGDRSGQRGGRDHRPGRAGRHAGRPGRGAGQGCVPDGPRTMGDGPRADCPLRGDGI